MNLETLRAWCAELPGATCDIKWGCDEVYSVGRRMFAVFSIEDGRARTVSFKCDPARFLELTDQPGIAPAPYLARAHWVRLRPSKSMSDRTVRTLVQRSHALVLAALTRQERVAIALPAQPAATAARRPSHSNAASDAERERPLRHAGNPRPRSARARDP